MMNAYPLTWPAGQPRSPAGARTDAHFQVPLGQARDRLLREIRLLGGRDVVISSAMVVRGDGLPYANQTEPNDPGVAVYFTRRVDGGPRPFVVACDQYRKVAWNLRAIGLTVEAMRTIQRHGSTALLERAFTGFAALPPAHPTRPWWQVLGVPENADASQVRAAYLVLCSAHHPDVGGDHDRMVEINAAYKAAGCP